MRFTDNASITSANMANDDILAGTDVSASADKKFSLASIADWLLNKFNGLSLAGSQQTVKSALDSLNSNLNNRLTGAVKSLSANTETNITIPNNYRGSVAFIGFDVNCNGMLMVATSSAGTVTYKWIGDAPSNITLATATRTLTVTSTQGVYLTFTNANQAIS